MRTRASLPVLARRVVVTTAALALLATPFASATEAAITSPFKPRLSVELSPGITYQAGTMRTTGGHPQQVFVAFVDTSRPEVQLKALLSNDRVVRRAVVSQIAVAKRKPGFRPMIATNGDMSLRNRVDAYAAPHSMAVSGGELLVAHSCTRPMLGIDSQGRAKVSNVRAYVAFQRGGQPFPDKVNRVNTHRDDDALVLYTPRFAARTQTRPGGVEVVLQMEDRLRANGVQHVTVLNVRRGGGNTPLRPGQAVLSTSDRSRTWVYGLQVGQRMVLKTQIVKKADRECGGIEKAARGWDDIVEAQGGNHFTLLNGAVAAPSRAEYYPGWQRHPRTNVGVTRDGRVLMVTVDGRRSASHGVTLAEMGQLMRSLGAVHSFNLDGGGSAVMARFNNAKGRFEVANKPSDGRQRPATQALAAFQVSPALVGAR